MMALMRAAVCMPFCPQVLDPRALAGGCACS